MRMLEFDQETLRLKSCFIGVEWGAAEEVEVFRGRAGFSSHCQEHQGIVDGPGLWVFPALEPRQSLGTQFSYLVEWSTADQVHAIFVKDEAGLLHLQAVLSPIMSAQMTLALYEEVTPLLRRYFKAVHGHGVYRECSACKDD
jgi:hypothetical protein